MLLSLKCLFTASNRLVGGHEMALCSQSRGSNNSHSADSGCNGGNGDSVCWATTFLAKHKETESVAFRRAYDSVRSRNHVPYTPGDYWSGL